MGKFNYEVASRGFIKQIQNWGDILAERNRISADTLSNQIKMRSNFFYKIMEQNAERQNKLRFIKEAQQQFGNQEDGLGIETGTPQMRVGAGGEPILHYESPREQEAKVNLGRKYIKTKQLRYEQTGDERFKPTEREMAFLEEHPEEIWSGKNIADPYELSSEQQVQARALARKISGVRGAENILPSIYEEMRKGKSIDEVEDTLRYAGQSPQFVGPVRDAAQTILINSPENISQKSMDYIDDLLSKGDKEGVKNQLKRLARTQASSEQQTFLVGKERTIKLLDEIQGDLNNLEQMGINTNIFTGTAEQVAAKLGTVINPEARKVATKISTAIQNYRRSMTGVQFGMPENKEYKVMFPSIGRTANFNTANINALKEVMQGDLDNFYSLSMGEDTYSQLFGGTKTENISNQPNLTNKIQRANEIAQQNPNLTKQQIIDMVNQELK
jgi:hypothetical protein